MSYGSTSALALDGYIHRSRGLRYYTPIGQCSSKVALNVGVHDWFEVLEFAVLKKVDDMDLKINRYDIFLSGFVYHKARHELN